MWPRKKFWWETGGTPPLQSPNPATTIPDDDPMFKWQAGMLFPTIPLETFDESKAAFSPIRERKILPMPYSYSHGSVDPGLVAANARVASGTTIPQTKKKSNKLKYIVEALKEMEGETPDALAGRDRVGGTRPGMSGYTPTNMGAYVGDPVAMQAAIAEARRKKEKESLMNLLGGGAY